MRRLPGEGVVGLAEVAGVQREQDAADDRDADVVPRQRRAALPQDVGDDGQEQRQVLRVDERERSRCTRRTSSSARAGRASAGTPRRRPARSCRSGSAKLASHRMRWKFQTYGASTTARREPRVEPQRPREPQQAERRHARAGAGADRGERDRVVRDEQQELVDLRRQRPVGHAEVAVEAVRLDPALLVGVPRLGEQPGLVLQPGDVADPEDGGDDRGREGERADEPPRRAAEKRWGVGGLQSVLRGCGGRGSRHRHVRVSAGVAGRASKRVRGMGILPM